ncbi:4Fe-4S dicluster domain-containing protein [Acidobacteria bacterium ACD]|nr:MAG: 4Fe-4S dicluster domain-containing protein [Acidobacteriota bacterium]MCE7957804.1 4Fe-4S dicluster domain-containing protein [Acidobacteria bacterium ACB2]MDL1948802.1 4Fe-4S dicluster domain-containing protein [Acidobacteria bacterium ACD]
MGHRSINPEKAYRLFAERLDRNVTGAPDSPSLRRILSLLFTPEDVELARQVPTRLTTVASLAARLGTPEDELDGRLTELARKGLVFDIRRGETRYVSLAPVVVGFFELTFMRGGADLPMKELSELFEAYFQEGEGDFARAVFGGSTQIGRALVRETALPAGDHVEVLDWERASWVVDVAENRAVSTCACRHHAEHLGRACDAPRRVCLSFGTGADALVRTGHAERVDRAEARRILREAQDAGLMQTGDNVKRKVGYICNCCGCCCGMLRSARQFSLPHAIVTSNWIMEVDEARCTGCGLCEKACPAGAIAIEEDGSLPGQRPKKLARRDEGLCLGCGVCVGSCKRGSLSMKARERRVFTPETTFERYVAMAVERGKLGDLLLDDPGDLPSQAIGRVVKVLEGLPPWKAVVAIEPLRSAFLTAFFAGVRPLARTSAKLLG